MVKIGAVVLFALGALALVLASPRDRSASADRTLPARVEETLVVSVRDGDPAQLEIATERSTPATAESGEGTKSQAADVPSPLADKTPDLPLSDDEAVERIAIQVRAALDKRIDVDAVDEPLHELLGRLGREHGVNFVLEAAALEETGVQIDTPITLHLKGVGLESALNTLLQDLNVAAVPYRDYVLVTSMEAAARQDMRVVYDVADLVCAPGRQEDSPRAVQDLGRLVIDGTEAQWKADDGDGGLVFGYVSEGVRALVVLAPFYAQEEVASTLAAIRKSRTAEGLEKIVPDTQREHSLRCAPQHPAPPEILRTLARPVSIDVYEQPLEKVIADFGKTLAVPIRLDRRTFEEVGIPLDTPVTLNCRDLTFRSVLELILKPLNLVWVIQDGAVVVTSHENATVKHELWYYNLDPLIGFTTSEGTREYIAADLKALVKATTFAQWEEDDGEGGLFEPFDLGATRPVMIRALRQDQEGFQRLFKGLLAARHDTSVRPETAYSQPATLVTQPEQLVPGYDVPRVVAKEVQSGAANSSNEFGLDLYRQLAKTDQGNLLISPYGISSAVALAFAGAKNQTADELAAALHVTPPALQFHDQMSTLQKHLALGSEGRPAQVRIANRLWAQAGLTIEPAFTELVDAKYGAGLGNVDFRDSTATRRTINDWIAEQTNFMIPGMLGEEDITSEFRFALTNAVYFEGRWQDVFDKQLTKADAFHTFRGDVRVPLMHRKAHYRYAKAVDGDGTCEAVELPYVGDELSMLLLLPTQGRTSFDKFEQQLTPELVQNVIAKLEDREVDLYMPRFRFDARANLIPVLNKLGVLTAFSVEADFSGISKDGIGQLVSVLHQARIEVDEEGTRAAAASFVGGFGGGRKSEPVEFRADRPFVLAIRDNPSGCLLFVGRVMEPAGR